MVGKGGGLRTHKELGNIVYGLFLRSLMHVMKRLKVLKIMVKWL